MIRENQLLLNRLNLLLDAAITVVSMVLAFYIRFMVMPNGIQTVPLREYLLLMCAVTPMTLMTFAILGLYESGRKKRLHQELSTLFCGNFLDVVFMVLLLYLLHKMDFSRWVLALYTICSSLLLGGKRIATRKVLQFLRRSGRNQKHVVIIGTGDLAQRYLKQIRQDRNLGYQAVGYVADTAWEALPCLGGYDTLEAVLTEQKPDEAICALPLSEYERTSKIISICEKTGTKLSIIPFYAAYFSEKPQVDSIGNLPLLNLRRIPLDNIGNAFVKRTMDIVGALVLIVVTSPIMLLTAVGVKLSSPGEIIFKQERVGRNKENFYMYKFRSMRKNTQQDTAWSTDHDPRKTKFGSWIRKCSIDELPQFFNVLKGDMSLVGPRPEIPHFVAQFKEEIPLYMVKHQVRPGITGWAQVNGLRGDTSIKDRIEYDLYYIENWNVLFDLKILFLTVFKGMINSEKITK